MAPHNPALHMRFQPESPEWATVSYAGCLRAKNAMEGILYHLDTLLCPGARDEASLRLICQCYELLGFTPGPAVFLLGLGAVLWFG